MLEIKSVLHKSKKRYFPLGTISLTGLVLLVFMLQEIVYKEQDVFALGFWPERFFSTYDLSTWGAEYLRLFSYAFVHENLPHVALNLIGMLYFGALVERYSGISRLLIIFLTAALVSALSFGLVHFFMLDQTHIALIGASGSISAFVGAAAYLRQFIPVIFWLIAEAAMIATALFISESIGYIAHLAGFAAGAALAGLIMPGMKLADRSTDVRQMYER